MRLDLTKENDDGSAEFNLSINSEEVQALVNLGLIYVLKKAIEEGKEYVPSEPSVGDTGSREQDCIYGPCVKSGKSELQCVCDQITKVPY